MKCFFIIFVMYVDNFLCFHCISYSYGYIIIYFKTFWTLNLSFSPKVAAYFDWGLLLLRYYSSCRNKFLLYELLRSIFHQQSLLFTRELIINFIFSWRNFLLQELSFFCREKTFYFISWISVYFWACNNSVITCISFTQIHFMILFLVCAQ